MGSSTSQTSASWDATNSGVVSAYPVAKGENAATVAQIRPAAGSYSRPAVTASHAPRLSS